MRFGRKRGLLVVLITLGITALFTAVCLCFQLLIACQRVQDRADRYFSAVEKNCEAMADASAALMREREEALLQLTRCTGAYYDEDVFRGTLERPKEEQTRLLQRICDTSDAEILLVTDEQGTVIFGSRSELNGENVVEKGYCTQEYLTGLLEREDPSAFVGENKISMLVYRAEDGTHAYVSYTYPVQAQGGRFHVITLADYLEIRGGMNAMWNGEVLLNTGSSDLFSIAVYSDENFGEPFTRIYYCEHNGKDHSGGTCAELGLTDAALKDGYAGFQWIDGVLCYCRSAVCRLYNSDFLIVMAGDISQMLNIPAFLCSIAVAAWFSLYLLVYGPRPMGAGSRRLLAMAATGVLVTAGVTFYTQTLSGMSSAIRQTGSAYRLLSDEIDGMDALQDEAQEASERIGVSQAGLIRMTVEMHPERYLTDASPDAYREYAVTGADGYSVPLLDDMGYPLRSVCRSEALQSLCDDFDMIRMTVYNADGYAIADSGSEWYDRITREAPETAALFDVLDRRRDADVSVPDDGRGLRRIAVPMDYYVRDDGGESAFITEDEYLALCQENADLQPMRHRYGLLVCWQTVPEILFQTRNEAMDYIVSSRETAQDCRFIIADTGAEHTLLYGGQGNEAASALPAAVFSDGNSGFFGSGDQRCFFCTRRYSGTYGDGLYIISAYPLSALHAHRTAITLASACAAAILLGVLAIVLGRVKRTAFTATDDAAHGIPSTGPYSWINPTVIIPFVLAFCWSLSGRWHSSILRYILFGSWEHGVNMFSLSMFGFMIAALLLLTRQIRYANGFFGLFSARSETLMSLTLSALKYVAYIFMIFYSLYLFGLDTGSVLRSLGAFALIVSLGAQSLIKDVIAGVFLVFDGTYHVGDIVQINDVRGRIVEVTLRTTKIENLQGTILTYNNSAIEKVENLSMNDSFLFFDIQVPSSNDPDEFVNKLLPWLDEVRQRNNEIRGRIEYDGIIETNQDFYTVRLTAHCAEQDRGSLWRRINREIVRFTQETMLYQK